MTYILSFLFLFSVSASAQVTQFTYAQDDGEEHVRMIFSPEGFVVKLKSFDVFYTRKSDKLLFVSSGKPFELAPSSKKLAMNRGGSNNEEKCEEYIEDSDTDYLALLCTSELDPLVVNYINDRYSISEYLKIYYGRLAGLSFPSQGKHSFPKLMQVLKKDTQEVVRTDTFVGVESLKVNEVKRMVHKYQTIFGQCDNIRQCFKIAHN
ncbi:MAG: hypothetical protein KC478_10580 [Bacteriovoracaceae bacterium]|nr:hypothetical protein [Bacteriovoracaceae bacterium]